MFVCMLKLALIFKDMLKYLKQKIIRPDSPWLKSSGMEFNEQSEKFPGGPGIEPGAFGKLSQWSITELSRTTQARTNFTHDRWNHVATLKMFI